MNLAVLHKGDGSQIAVPDHQTARGGAGIVRRAVRLLMAVLMLATAISVLAISIGVTGNAAHKDFISYWAAGRLLLDHSNPYDASAVFRLEKSVGFSEPRPLVMRNPPYALPLAIAVGWLGPNAAVVIWSLMIVAALVASIRILWILGGRAPDRLHLLGYVFAPSIACVQSGQTPTFALFGLALFLYFIRTRPVVAGLFFPLLALKPHLLLPFGVVLVGWVFVRRAWSVLAGGLAGMALALAIPFSLNVHLWARYLEVLRAANDDARLIPTLSTLLRAASPTSSWLQFVPAALGCAWAAWYFNGRRRSWDWHNHGSLVLLVSVWTAPYAWFFDEIILLPAILRGVRASVAANRSLASFGIIDALALGLTIWGIPLSSGAFIWTSTAWLAWYVYGTRVGGVRIASLPEPGGPAGGDSSPSPRRDVLPSRNAGFGVLHGHGRVMTSREVRATDSGNALGREILGLLRDWRFRPALRDKTPVNVEVLLIVPPRN